MSKVDINNLTSLVSDASATAKLNENFSNIQNAIDNTLSRDGTAPNTLDATLDMNSQQIVNLPMATTDTEPVRYKEFQEIVDLASGAAGTPGAGVAVGGTSGMILKKASGVDYNTAWETVTTALVGASVTPTGNSASKTLADALAGPLPADYEIVDLEYFLRRQALTNAGKRTALTNAHKALFNDGIARGKLECHGIPITIDTPYLLRTSDLTMGAGALATEKIITGLNLKANSAGTWSAKDFLYSIAGEQGVANLSYLTIDKPRFDVNGLNIVGCHVSGYYHVTLMNPRIRGLGGTGGIGIYSSKYATATGIGNPGGGAANNTNHGLHIIHPDIRGTSGSEDTSTGIYLEDGDCDIRGGWLSFLRVGVNTRRGGLNTEGVHFSMADKLDMTIAIKCAAPRSISFLSDELDGCCYEFYNPTDNMFTEGVSYEAPWANVSLHGMKFSGSAVPGGDTAGYGLINFKTITAGNYINGLSIEPDWGTITGTTIDTVNFSATGAGSWTGSSFNEVLYKVPHNANGNPGQFPSGAKLRITRSDQGGSSYGLRGDTATGALEFISAGAGGNYPYLKADGNEFYMGKLVSGTQTNRWNLTTNGHFRPVDTNTYDLGGSSNTIKDFYLEGNLYSKSGTASATAGAATLNKKAGLITTESLTTAAFASNTPTPPTSYTLTLTNSVSAAGDLILATVGNGTNNAGIPILGRCKCLNGSVTFLVYNLHTANAFNGTLLISFFIVKA